MSMLSLVGHFGDLGFGFDLFTIACGVHLVYQISVLNPDNPAKCGQLFRSNWVFFSSFFRDVFSYAS